MNFGSAEGARTNPTHRPRIIIDTTRSTTTSGQHHHHWNERCCCSTDCCVSNPHVVQSKLNSCFYICHPSNPASIQSYPQLPTLCSTTREYFYLLTYLLHHHDVRMGNDIQLVECLVAIPGIGGQTRIRHTLGTRQCRQDDAPTSVTNRTRATACLSTD